MHWHEGYVYTDEERPEVDFPQQVIVLQANHFLDSEVPGSEDRKYRTHRQDVMEMSYHIICVVKSNVDTGVSQYNTRQSTDSEKQDESNRKVCWSFILDYTIPHSGQPAEDFDTGWYSNNHRSGSEIHARIYI